MVLNRICGALSRCWRLISLSWRLGLGNVTRVLLYRLRCKTGLLRLRLPAGTSYPGPFLYVQQGKKKRVSRAKEESLEYRVNRLAAGYMTYFFSAEHQVSAPPNWLFDPYSNFEWSGLQHWSSISEIPGVDIKCVWEPSRFQWMLDFAKQYQSDGDASSLRTVQQWLESWIAANPANRGPNWFCGQETAIRLIHFLTSLYLIEQHHEYFSATKRFVREHCERIAATTQYAIAQDNNHATSEAIGLIAGAMWLLASDDPSITRRASKWLCRGTRLLERGLDRLVASDGSFSQHSTNYHRLVLDSLCFMEFWRTEFAYSFFSDDFYRHARAMTGWLIRMTDPISGDAPNLGGNDGAQIFKLSECEYRDFRPTIQLAATLFLGESIYEVGPWDEQVTRLGIRICERNERAIAKKALMDGGYVWFGAAPGGWGVLRLPSYHFRPAHSDALHLDLWDANGVNRIRDGGTYSYSAKPEVYEYFAGTESHSTCRFDNRDQMPRLGRFLFDRWLKPAGRFEFTSDESGVTATATYVDWRGACHRRIVTWRESVWTVRDELEGYRAVATVIWRLNPGAWQASDGVLSGEGLYMEYEILEGRAIRDYLSTGFESRYYLQKSPVPVWKVEFAPPKASVVTVIRAVQ